MLAPWKKSYDQTRQHIKKQRHYSADKSLSSQSYGFSSSDAWMWELNYKESWVLKNWCFWTVVLEKTLESPLDCKEIKPVNPKGNQSWIFIGRTDAEAETPILWPPDAKNWLLGKDLMLGKIKGRRWRGWRRMRWLDGITNSMGMTVRKFRRDGLSWSSLLALGSAVIYCGWQKSKTEILMLPSCISHGHPSIWREKLACLLFKSFLFCMWVTYS